MTKYWRDFVADAILHNMKNEKRQKRCIRTYGVLRLACPILKTDRNITWNN